MSIVSSGAENKIHFFFFFFKALKISHIYKHYKNCLFFSKAVNFFFNFQEKKEINIKVNFVG